ncbi:hypothetical protein OS493_015458 [Desmophyllum pertusum]|uniref:Uncharacterized protein n=1 Tax=Desmophyllum pertusum TaxID=174260 RepID=A0A9X0CSW7_9CNID|nr:hypothetical protein OS493_015458 [Desmophyllum pertusum]
MFVVVVFCVIGTIVAFTTTMYPSVYYGVIGALIIIATTLILVLLFTNKIVRLSCKRKRTKTILSGETSEDNSTCACGAAFAKSFFCGSRSHPPESGRVESKSEFYIGGVLQDRDAEIVYLKNELREKETMLSNLGPRRTLKSNSTPDCWRRQ